MKIMLLTLLLAAILTMAHFNAPPRQRRPKRVQTLP
jgi:hypothetical protein